MSATVGDLKHAAQVQFVRAQRTEQKAETIQHALNLALNFGFERFHIALTEGIDVPPVPKSAGSRRIVLWRTTFPKDIFTPQHSMSPNSDRSPSI